MYDIIRRSNVTTFFNLKGMVGVHFLFKNNFLKLFFNIYNHTLNQGLHEKFQISILLHCRTN
jgi:hypothetical protein